MKKFKNVLILAVINLTDEGETVDTSRDSIIIPHHEENIPGGKSLDVTGVDATLYPVISAGHPVIRETATGNYKALGITDGAFVALPSGHTYAGVVRASVLTTKPMASVMVRGTVNTEAFKNWTKQTYGLTSGLVIPTAVQATNTFLRLTSDQA